MKKIIFITLISLFTLSVKSQIAAGDIAFIGFNEDLPVDGFSVITLNSIPGNATIYFTDQGISTPTTWAANSEDHWRFTAPASGISCGTIISFTEDAPDVLTITGVSGASMVHLAGTGLFNLSGGDQMIAYTVSVPGVPASPASAIFIAAITTDDGNGAPTCLDGITGWSSAGGCIGTSVSRSLVPPGLTNGVDCISLHPTIGTEIDNNKYNGTLTGTSSFIRASINNRTNWISNDITIYNITPSGYISPSIVCGSPCPTPTVSLNAQTNISCNGGSNGSASITANGGSPFTYAWSPSGGTGATATGLSAGNYTCVTTNSCGATASTTVLITQPSALITSTAATNPLCNGTNGSATVTATGGTAPYTYTWSSGPTTSVEPTLLAGSYTIRVIDNNGCNVTKTVTITQPSAIVSATAVTNVACNGGSNGVASISASGGAGGYSYLWSNGGATSAITGLMAGAYTATVTDANGCKSIKGVTITQPTALALTPASQTNISCNGGSNGAASVNAASGGAGGFTYNWTPGNPTGDGTTTVAGLTAQVYTCTVTDVNSCTTSTSFNITQPTAIVLTPVSQTNISCNGGSNGAASVNPASGGAGGFTYNWTPGNPTGDGTTAVTGLTSQVYTCTVTDANSCTRTQTFNITQPTALALTPASQTNISCNGGSNGAASVNAATGGAGGYTYNWTPGNPTGDGTTSVAGLTTGTWTCTVTDANSCTRTQTFNVTQPTALALTPASQTNISCNGGSNGAASVNAATGGAGGYTYNWTPGNPTGDGTTTVAGLTAQVYTCTVTDANSCTTSTSFNITQPVSALATATAVTNISCFGGANGSATLTASGGTSSYTYLWSTGATTSVITSLSLGTKSYTVTDANGCTSTGSVVISQATQISANIGSSPTSCTGNTGSASVTSPAGGAGGYTYSWAPSGGTANTATSLGVGNYTCTVTDANSCSITKTVSVITASGPSLISLSQTNIACFGNSTGTASVNNATGGTTPYTYNWTPGNPTGDGTTSVTGLTAQVYTCTVTDANGCSAFQTFNITQPTSALATSTAVTNVACFGNSTGAATVTASGGTSAYSYLWSTGATTSVIVSQASGLKTVTVTDANGCTSIKSVSISQPATALATATAVTNVACFGNSTGAATVTATGGTSAYTYLWSTGATTSVIASQTSGVRTVTVTDANGCTSIKSVSISQPATALATATAVTNVACFGNSTGAATVTATGGTSAYTYLWSTGATTSVIASQTSGVRTVTVTDANGCLSVNSLTITQPVILALTAVANNSAICAGSSSTLSANGTGGSGIITYAWVGGPTNSVSIVSPTITSIYTVSVTDANGCTSTKTVEVIVNSTPTISVNSGTICSGNTFTIIPSGALTYTIEGGNNLVNPIATTSYTIVGTNFEGCVSSNTVSSNVTVFTTPTISVNSGSVCSGNTFTIVPSGASTYTIEGTNNVVNPLTSATYTVIGTSTDGCQSSNIALSSLTVYALPNISVTTSNTLLCTGNSANLNATGALNYIWSTSESSPNIVVTPSITTTYTVTGTDADGCSNTEVFTQDVSTCTSIDYLSNTNSATLIYPNPTSGEFYIDSREVAKVVITDILGKIIFEKNLEVGKNLIDLSKYEANVYTIIIRTDLSTHVVKLIHQ